MRPYSVCLIGSSHTAALLHAWRNRSFNVSPDFSLTFFAAGGHRLTNLLFPPEGESPKKANVTSSTGKDRILPSEYDALVLYAFGLSFAQDVLEFCRRYGTAEHRECDEVENLLSTECFAAAIAAVLTQSGAISYLASIRSSFSGPVFICPTPLLPKRLFQSDFIESRFADPKFLSAIFSIFVAAVSSLCAQHGAEVVWQDGSTTETPCFTKESFSLGSVKRSGKPRGEGHNKHMNEDYGALEIGRLLARLDEISGGRVLERAGRRESGNR